MCLKFLSRWTLPFLAATLTCFCGSVQFGFCETARDASSNITPDVAPQAELPLPAGWICAGSHPEEYDMGVDEKVSHGGTKSGCIRTVAKETTGFGTLMQEYKATDFLGKRVRLTSWLKTADVHGWAGMWMRVDGPQGSKKMLAFDNMQHRSLQGTVDWKEVEIVLDVADKAENIAFGVLLNGSGTVWMDSCKFEIVSKDVPTTDSKSKSDWIQDKPTNLNFEEVERM